MIYLDHASTTPLCDAAKEAVLDAFSCVGNPSSDHGAGHAAHRLLQQARGTIADCLACEPEELVFVSSGTEANALALHGRTRVAVSAIEHASVLRNAPDAAIIPATREGSINLSAAKKIIADASFVSVQYANNELGTLLPVREVGNLCKRAGALFHTDAVQAVGHVPIRLCDEPFDLLSMSAHKFGGPMGVGALYCKKDTALFPLICGGRQERGRRAGTENVPLICGMAAALRESVLQMEQENKRLRELKRSLQNELIKLGGKPFDGAPTLDTHVHVMFFDRDARALLHALDLLGVCASAGAACHGSETTPSHVLLAVGMTERAANSCMRFSLGRTTTQSDIDALVGHLARILK